MIETKHCSNCNIQIDINEKSCWNCGKPVLRMENLIEWLDSEFDGYFQPSNKYELLNLTSLDFSNNHLTQIPCEICLLNNLTDFRLFMNSLKELPKEFGLLTNLSKLDIHYNNLYEVPTTIFQLTKLTLLDLSYNNITELPKQISFLINLTSLNLSGNNITEIPKEIGLLTKLKKLYLSENQLTALPLEINTLVNLEEISLIGNNFEEIPNEIDFFSKLNISNIEEAHFQNLNGDKIIRLKKYSTQEKQELIESVEKAAYDYSRGAGAHGAPRRSENLDKILQTGLYAEIPLDFRLGEQVTRQYDIYLWAVARYLKGITPNTKEALDPYSDYSLEFRRELKKQYTFNGFYGIKKLGFNLYIANFKNGNRDGNWIPYENTRFESIQKPAITDFYTNRLIDELYGEQIARDIHYYLQNKNNGISCSWPYENMENYTSQKVTHEW